MDHEKISQVVEDAVLSAFKENQEYVTRGLAEGLDWEDGWEKTLSLALFNAVHVSTRLSVQMTLTILYETGVLEPSENMETLPKLTVIRGGADPVKPEKSPEK